jgi:hypothetical protein
MWENVRKDDPKFCVEPLCLDPNNAEAFFKRVKIGDVFSTSPSFTSMDVRILALHHNVLVDEVSGRLPVFQVTAFLPSIYVFKRIDDVEVKVIDV